MQEIAENSHVYRTLGLGFANLGALIMSYGLGYDSDEGRALAGAITSIMTGHAYEQSARMSQRMGAFPGYEKAQASGARRKPLAKDNIEPMLEVINLHRESVKNIQASERFAFLKEEAQRCWDTALELGKKHGYRNAQVTVLAPTGTIGFLMDCDTTGIEPDIALVKYKLLAGGGMLKIVNQTVAPALRNLGYETDEIARVITPHRCARHHRGRAGRADRRDHPRAGCARSTSRSSIAPSSPPGASAACISRRTSR